MLANDSSSIVRLSVAVLCCVALGCSGTTKKGNEPQKPKEIVGENSPTITSDSVGQTFKMAKHYYQKGLFTLAKTKFDALRSHPKGRAFAQYASIKSADCLMFSGDAATAIEEYLSFAENYPTSPLVPYALFQAGQAQQIKSPGVGRDPSSLYKAKEIFEKVIREHPKSKYSRIALEHFIKIENRLKEHRAKIAEFYADHELTQALRARLDFASLEERRQMDLVDELSQIVKDAPRLDIKKQDISPRKVVDTSSDAPVKKAEVEDIVCSPNEWDMILYLDGPLGEDVRISRDSDLVHFKLPNVAAIPELPSECSAWKKGNTNVLTRTGSETADVLYLSKPDRVVLLSGAESIVLP